MFVFISYATCEWPEMHSFQLSSVLFCSVTHLMVDKNLKLLENGATHLQDIGDVIVLHRRDT